jgi:predicted nucleic acid-binding protein
MIIPRPGCYQQTHDSELRRELALEKRDRLFMDDLKGRRTAEFYRLETTTTLGIILELLANGALSGLDYQKNVKSYGSQGWISGDVVQEFIERGKDLE